MFSHYIEIIANDYVLQLQIASVSICSLEDQHHSLNLEPVYLYPSHLLPPPPVQLLNIIVSSLHVHSMSHHTTSGLWHHSIAIYKSSFKIKLKQAICLTIYQ